MPTIPLVPHAQVMLSVAHVSKVAPLERVDDVSMGSCPAMPTPSPTAPLPYVIHTSVDFLKSFPQVLHSFEPLEAWLDEAAQCKLPMGHLVTAIQTAGHADMLSNNQFIALIQCFFSSYPVPSAQK
jgi:hypothetical protein